MPETFPVLDRAFRATVYRVYGVESEAGAETRAEEGAEAGVFDLCIGEKHAAFDDFLHRRGVTHWAIVTACNPGAQCHDAVFNAAAQGRLLARIQAAGWDCRPALNRAEQGTEPGNIWPDEPGWLLLGIDRTAACSLAADFGQLACVYGERGAAPMLLWVA